MNSRGQAVAASSDRPFIIQAFYVLCATVLFKVVGQATELTLQVFSIYQAPIVWAFLISIPARYLVSWVDYILSPDEAEDEEDTAATPRKRRKRNRARIIKMKNAQNIRQVFSKKESDWVFEWLFGSIIAWFALQVLCAACREQ